MADKRTMKTIREEYTGYFSMVWRELTVIRKEYGLTPALKNIYTLTFRNKRI